jgi:hypothetical protein
MTALLFWSMAGAAACAAIASFKGRSIIGWLFIGLFTGLLGVIVIACIPPLPQSSNDEASSAQQGPLTMAPYDLELLQNRKKSLTMAPYDLELLQKRRSA